MQFFRNLVVICAFIGAAVITLVQFLRRGAAPTMNREITKTLKDRAGNKKKRWIFRSIAILLVVGLATQTRWLWGGHLALIAAFGIDYRHQHRLEQAADR